MARHPRHSPVLVIRSHVQIEEPEEAAAGVSAIKQTPPRRIDRACPRGGDGGSTRTSRGSGSAHRPPAAAGERHAADLAFTLDARSSLGLLLAAATII